MLSLHISNEEREILGQFRNFFVAMKRRNCSDEVVISILSFLWPRFSTYPVDANFFFNVLNLYGVSRVKDEHVLDVSPILATAAVLFCHESPLHSPLHMRFLSQLVYTSVVSTIGVPEIPNMRERITEHGISGPILQVRNAYHVLEEPYRIPLDVFLPCLIVFVNRVSPISLERPHGDVDTRTDCCDVYVRYLLRSLLCLLVGAKVLQLSLAGDFTGALILGFFTLGMCAFLGYGYYKYHHNASIYEASLPVVTLIQNYLPVQEIHDRANRTRAIQIINSGVINPEIRKAIKDKFCPSPSFSFFAHSAPNTPIDDNSQGVELTDLEQPLLAHVV